MNEPVENLVERLHAKRSGDGWKAKCPIHDDREPSISISEGADGRALIKCHAGCETNEILAAIDLKSRDLFVAGGKNGSEPPKQRPPQKTNDENAQPINWQQCVEGFTDKHLERLGEWRGLTGRFCSWLKRQGLVGLCENTIAFPVIDKQGHVIAAHCRPKSGKWFYKPGTPVQPFIIGDLITANQVHVFESQWDMFAFMDRAEFYLDPAVAFVATRGAGNAKLIKGLLRKGISACAWPQNDEPGQKWLKDLGEHADVPIASALVPPEHEDMNAWCKAGAIAEDVRLAFFKNELVEVPKPPELGTLLGDICEFLRRFIIFESNTQPIICALWVAHAWAIDAFDFTPYLNIGSPEKRAGKTQSLECLNRLVRTPWLTLSVTEAVLFREIDKTQPTLLLDESDALFKKGGGGNDDRRDGKVLVAGGDAISGTSTELYDPATGIWTVTGSMKNRRSFATATLLPNGHVLVAGGFSDVLVAGAELYDPATGVWTATGNLNVPRDGHTATLLQNGQVLVAAGHGGSGYLASAELYNPATGVWTATGDLITARSDYPAALLPNGQVLVAGGISNDGFHQTDKAEVYDPATGSWAATASFKTRALWPYGDVAI